MTKEDLPMWILWSSYPVPTIVKSCSECSKTPLFVENVEVVPGTANTVLAAVCISYPVPNSCKSCQQDPISTVFVENVGVLPGTVNKVTFCCGLWGYLTWYLQSSNHALSALKAHFLWKMWMFYLVPIILRYKRLTAYTLMQETVEVFLDS